MAHVEAPFKDSGLARDDLIGRLAPSKYSVNNRTFKDQFNLEHDLEQGQDDRPKSGVNRAHISKEIKKCVVNSREYNNFGRGSDREAEDLPSFRSYLPPFEVALFRLRRCYKMKSITATRKEVKNLLIVKVQNVIVENGLVMHRLM